MTQAVYCVGPDQTAYFAKGTFLLGAAQISMYDCVNSLKVFRLIALKVIV